MKDAPTPAGRSPAPQVFVLDDEEVVLRVLTRTLKRAGFEVAAYSSPRAFLEQARLAPPCCLVLDVNMPEISGVEIQQRLAQMEQPPSIIFISGIADVGVSVRAMKAGAIDFLAKPFEPHELIAAVGVALRRAEERYATRAAMAEARKRLSRLTPREREVCELVARGLRSKQIADAIGAAVKTVNIHRSRVMSKLDVSSVVDLVRLLENATETRG